MERTLSCWQRSVSDGWWWLQGSCQTGDSSRPRCNDGRFHRSTCPPRRCVPLRQTVRWPRPGSSALALDQERLKRESKRSTDMIVSFNEKGDILSVLIRKLILFQTNQIASGMFCFWIKRGGLISLLYGCKQPHLKGSHPGCWESRPALGRWCPESPLSSLWSSHTPDSESWEPADPGTSSPSNSGCLCSGEQIGYFIIMQGAKIQQIKYLLVRPYPMKLMSIYAKIINNK